MMNEKRIAFALALACAPIFALAATASPVIAQNQFSDITCPNATQPVRDYDEKRRNPHPLVNNIILQLIRVIEAYELCAAERLTEINQQTADRRAELSSDQGPERAHYAQVRASQYQVVLGRLWRILERYDASRAAFEKAVDLVKDTIDWQSSSQVTWRSNNRSIGSSSTLNHAPIHSSYRKDALAVREEALKEMAWLNKMTSPDSATSSGVAPTAAPAAARTAVPN
jgi:tetratricopeptide (TPR) repeat protein